MRIWLTILCVLGAVLRTRAVFSPFSHWRDPKIENSNNKEPLETPTTDANEEHESQESMLGRTPSTVATAYDLLDRILILVASLPIIGDLFMSDAAQHTLYGVIPYLLIRLRDFVLGAAP